VAEQCPPDRTFFLASSKSGSTIETRAHLEWSWARSGDPSRFGVLTDPGSALGDLARARGFAHVWENDPDIGGRYSALSLFGMVPAALIGVDGDAILDAADEAAELLGPLGDDAALHIGLRLGAVLGAAAASGRTLVTLRLDPRIAGFAAWLEQLLAESLGKHGKGILPMYGEADDVVMATPERRVLVEIGEVEPLDIDAPRVAIALEEPSDIGAQVLWWEFATAIAGRVLGVNPFDQPNVESAKIAARKVLDDGAPEEPESTSVDDALALLGPGETIIIDAFVDPGGRAAERLVAVRDELAHELTTPTSLGIGPRFLHSTGQMHKGGPDDAVHLQVVEQPLVDVQIPDQSFTFGTLLRAQAAGDLSALREAGKRAVRVELEELMASRTS
jgi:transaldolase/glucose-6-phosphate isomerase